MQVDGFAVEVFKQRVSVKALGDLIGGIGIVTHDEEEGLFAAGLPLGLAGFPAFITQEQMLFPAVGGVVVGLLD